MSLAFKVDVTQIGLDEMREYPELGESNSPSPKGHAIIDAPSPGLRMGFCTRLDEHLTLPHQVELPVICNAEIALDFSLLTCF